MIIIHTKGRQAMKKSKIMRELKKSKNVVTINVFRLQRGQ